MASQLRHQERDPAQHSFGSDVEHEDLERSGAGLPAAQVLDLDLDQPAVVLQIGVLQPQLDVGEQVHVAPTLNQLLEIVDEPTAAPVMMIVSLPTGFTMIC